MPIGTHDVSLLPLADFAAELQESCNCKDVVYGMGRPTGSATVLHYMDTQHSTVECSTHWDAVPVVADPCVCLLAVICSYAHQHQAINTDRGEVLAGQRLQGQRERLLPIDSAAASHWLADIGGAQRLAHL